MAGGGGGSHQMSTRSASGRWLAMFMRMATDASIISSLGTDRLQDWKRRSSRWGKQTGEKAEEVFELVMEERLERDLAGV